MNNEWLLAFETEQAKRNTKHSSERTVITHKPVSALLEGLLLCVNDLSCLWHACSVALSQSHVMARQHEINLSFTDAFAADGVFENNFILFYPYNNSVRSL